MVIALRRWSLAFLFHFRSRVLGREVRQHHVRNPWHSVSIRSVRFAACPLARACAGRRFLSSDAPPLPLPGCNAARCECHYLHHEDRREGPRRVADQGITAPYHRGRERRRRSGGRRSDDH